MEYSVEKSDLQTSVEKRIEELQLSVEPYVFVPVGQMLVGGVSAGSSPRLAPILEELRKVVVEGGLAPSQETLQLRSAVFSVREKLDENLEENLVNSTDRPGGDHVTAEDTPILMFKIASKRKKCSQTW